MTNFMQGVPKRFPSISFNCSWVIQVSNGEMCPFEPRIGCLAGRWVAKIPNL